ncbi:MAG: methylaspartate ammonia-lyase [Deltaproteobacteria bacterium]|nr:methylaspartate ammonia-lyase [Deltaproteobacteria bacterium]
MKIDSVLLAPGLGAFFYDDQSAISKGALQDGECYVGKPLTPGFKAIRIPAATLSIGLVLENGFIAWGDMMSVQYAGAAGRDPVFDPKGHSNWIRRYLVPLLKGLSVNSFTSNADALCQRTFYDLPMHKGIQYGLTQALLRATAYIQKRPMAGIICAEYGLPVVIKPVPIFGQSGDERYRNVDKAILKKIPILPHGLINSKEKFGEAGETFIDYVRWVVQRVQSVGGSDYKPILHFDLYGMAGKAFDLSVAIIADYLFKVESAAAPLQLRIESPADFGSVKEQIAGLAQLRQQLHNRGSRLKIVADEWCNTLADIQMFISGKAADLIQIKMPDLGGIQNSISAVNCCREAGVGAYLGGSCAETDISARVAVHVAIATQADMQLAKPGMGLDEGIMTVTNEQNRLLAELSARKEKNID